ncbi:cyanophycinase [Pontibacter pudoricolor]|uniref:cyanophycinase n=1 Tax=Pontibacter pudoricolor TaxID=2694930 RepID=UPI00139168F6|nr:cyanophycinase [Pontibacter pudoricolor]
MKTPKGKIVAIGGNEDKGNLPLQVKANEFRQQHQFDHGILKRIHDELHGLGTRIEVVTTATLAPAVAGKVYTNAFFLLGCNNVGVLPIQSPEDANRPDYLERLMHTDAVMFTGGDQQRITAAFQGSEALNIIKTRYMLEDKFLISGTSAGAMALSGVMINGYVEATPLLKGMVELTSGLDILDKIIIDTHFVNRRRIPRMIEAIASNPSHIGIGLGEDTGILITGNDFIETIGSGLVIVIDGRKLVENNYQTIDTGEALCVENLIMHVLPRGRSFHITSGKFV